MKKFSVLLALAFSLVAFNAKSLSLTFENDIAQSGSVFISSSPTFSKIDLYANIETIGVVVSDSNLPATADLVFNRDGETSWHAGYPIKRIDNGRLVSSLFGLSPSTSYNIKVINGITEIVGKVTTQPDELQFTPTAILYVNGNAAPSGNGSQAAPFKTIQEGVNHATPGTQVLVADGIYQENVSFPASGCCGQLDTGQG